MGVDVNLFAEGDFTNDEIADAEQIAQRLEIAWLHRGAVLIHSPADKEHPLPRVEFSTASRYYGPGYERGNWPAIYAAIRLMRTAFPGRVIRYGADHDSLPPAATSEYLDRIWGHYLGVDGDQYLREISARFG